MTKHSGRPLAAMLAALALGAAGCGRTGDADTKLNVTGSSTVAPLAAEIARRFETRHPGARIDVQTGGSSRGIADVRGGLAQVGMASRALDASEADLLAFPIARDGVALFVHRDNPVAELSDAQVVAIYTGEVDNWSAVGGPDAAITVVSKAAGRATLAVFLDHFGLEERAVAADVLVGDNQQAIKTVIADPNAVAYVSIGTAEHDAARGVPIRLLAAGGVAATSENLAAGRFPIARPLNFVTRGEPTGLAREFIDFARSAEVHDLIRDLHFVPTE